MAVRPVMSLMRVVALSVALAAAAGGSVGEASEQTISYSYDEAGRLVEALYDDGTRVVYTYDRNGNLLDRRVESSSGPGQLELSGGSYTATEAAGSVTISVRRIGGIEGAVSVHWSTADGTANGGDDYTTASGDLAWADGDGRDRAVAIEILDDQIAEADESFTVSLSDPTGGASLGDSTSAEITILDDDGAAGAELMVPVIAHLAGVGGTPWRSDAALSSTSGQAETIVLEYHPSPTQVVTRQHLLAPRATVLWEDVVASLFEQGDGRGPLLMRAGNGATPPAVLSRTFAAYAEGNLGQGVPALAPFGPGTYALTGLLHDEEFRSNVAVAAGGSAVTVTFDLLRGTEGEVMTGVERHVEAFSQDQWSLEALFPDQARPGVAMTLRVALSAPAIQYASLVDNTSTDATTFVATAGGSAWTVPVVAHLPGAEDTFWESDVGLANLGASTVTVDLEYLPEGTDNGGGGLLAVPVELGPHGSVVLGDIAQTLFGVTNGKGTLVVTASSDIVVSSRVYTTRSDGGTSGHGVGAVAPEAFSAATRTLPGVRTEGGFRTNLGFVSGNQRADLALTLHDGDGTELGVATATVPARSLLQVRVANLFAGSGLPSPAGAVQVTTTAPILAYVVIVDGSSQDPAYALQSQ